MEYFLCGAKEASWDLDVIFLKYEGHSAMNQSRRLFFYLLPNTGEESPLSAVPPMSARAAIDSRGEIQTFRRRRRLGASRSAFPAQSEPGRTLPRAWLGSKGEAAKQLPTFRTAPGGDPPTPKPPATAHLPHSQRTTPPDGMYRFTDVFCSGAVYHRTD